MSNCHTDKRTSHDPYKVQRRDTSDPTTVPPPVDASPGEPLVNVITAHHHHCPPPVGEPSYRATDPSDVLRPNTIAGLPVPASAYTDHGTSDAWEEEQQPAVVVPMNLVDDVCDAGNTNDESTASRVVQSPSNIKGAVVIVQHYHHNPYKLTLPSAARGVGTITTATTTNQPPLTSPLLVVVSRAVDATALRRRLKLLISKEYKIDRLDPEQDTSLPELMVGCVVVFSVVVNLRSFALGSTSPPPCRIHGLAVIRELGPFTDVYDGRNTCVPIAAPPLLRDTLDFRTLEKLFMGQVPYVASVDDVWGILRCILARNTNSDECFQAIQKIESVIRWSSKRRVLGFHVYCNVEFMAQIIAAAHNTTYCNVFMELSEVIPEETYGGPQDKITLVAASSNVRHRRPRRDDDDENRDAPPRRRSTTSTHEHN